VTTSQGYSPTYFERYEELGEVPFQQLDLDQVAVWERLPGNPDYAVVGTFFISNRGPQLIGLSFSPWSYEKWPVEMLTTAMIRSAPLDRLYELTRYAISHSQAYGINLDVDLTEFARNRRPGRSGRPDVFYARLAAEYVELLSTSSTPTKDLARRHNYSPTSMRDYLNQARVRGLLTPSQRGRAGGELTEKAMRLLRAEPGSEKTRRP
jgi:hypothetical protein